MKHFYILATLFILSFSPVNAQYYWQVVSVSSITGGGTYNQNDTPNSIVLNINQCAGGIRKPHNLTNYNLKWYVNSIDSNSGGDLVSSSYASTEAIYNPTVVFTPPTDVVGTFYYYAEFSDPTMTTCGFTTPFVTLTQKVIINSTLGVGDVNLDKNKLQIFPNPASDFIFIKNFNPNTKTIKLFDLGGKLIRTYDPSQVKENKIFLTDLVSGNYIFKIDNLSQKIIVKK